MKNKPEQLWPAITDDFECAQNNPKNKTKNTQMAESEID